MKAEEIREGDIVEIDYITEFTKEHINEGKALVIWKSFNNQPLVRKLDTKKAIWTCYEHIARVVGHIDIAGYMDRALSAEPCEDAISRQAVYEVLDSMLDDSSDNKRNQLVSLDSIADEIAELPPVTPHPKMGHWIYIGNSEVNGLKIVECSECGKRTYGSGNYCPICGTKMESEE